MKQAGGTGSPRYSGRPMQTDWLIDFMTLAQTRSFSRSAQLRHVTQPAFSRRIRSLEAWASAELVDRTCHPPSLTPAGKMLHAQVPELVASIQHIHTLLRAHAPLDQDRLRFACPPVLAFHFFPAWICRADNALGAAQIRLACVEPRKAFDHLSQGDCDLLLVHLGHSTPAAATCCAWTVSGWCLACAPLPTAGPCTH